MQRGCLLLDTGNPGASELNSEHKEAIAESREVFFVFSFLFLFNAEMIP